MNSLTFDHVPSTPHIELLKALSVRAWKNPEVQAIWIGGSIASGHSDQYSDIDFRIAVAKEHVSSWSRPGWQSLLPEKCVGSTLMTFGEHSVLHHMVLESGTIIDYLVQETGYVNREVNICLIAARNKDLSDFIVSFGGKEPVIHTPVNSEQIQQLLVEYWISSLKHLKVIKRNRAMMTVIGLHHERMALMRAWFIYATGKDLATRPTIHALNNMIAAIESSFPNAWDILGMPVRTIEEAITAIETIRKEMRRVGRSLSLKYSFEYPMDLDKAVCNYWRNNIYT